MRKSRFILRIMAFWKTFIIRPYLALIVFPLLGLCGFSQSTLAAPTCSGDICSDVMIKNFYVHSNGSIYITVDGQMNNLSCTLDSGYYIFIPKISTSSEI